MRKYLEGNSRLFLFVVLITASCSSEFLEIEPQQAISSNMAFKNIIDFEKAIIGVYDELSSSNYYGKWFILIGDVLSDDVKLNPSSSRSDQWYEYQGNSNGQYQLANNIWFSCYQVIHQCNRIISAEIELPDSQENKYNDIVGQAYALRALAHFDLCKTYSQHYTFTNDASHLGIPIVTNLNVLSKPARNTVKEVYEQVILDFNTALDLIGDGSNSFYFNKNVVNAFLSRVYLYKEDWTKVVTFSTELINSVDYSLVENEDYSTIFSVDHSAETIFEINMSQFDNNGDDALGKMYCNHGYGLYLPTNDLINLISEGDARLSTFIEDEYLPGGIYGSRRVNKYSSLMGDDNTPVIRLSEVILNRAEANAHLNNTTDAQADLNLIHQRGLLSANEVTTSGASLINEILNERRIELCYEGHRLFDLTRNKMGVYRNDCTAVPNACTIEYPNNFFILPIGKLEMDVNPNMIQNPGY